MPETVTVSRADLSALVAWAFTIADNDQPEDALHRLNIDLKTPAGETGGVGNEG